MCLTWMAWSNINIHVTFRKGLALHAMGAHGEAVVALTHAEKLVALKNTQVVEALRMAARGSHEPRQQPRDVRDLGGIPRADGRGEKDAWVNFLNTQFRDSKDDARATYGKFDMSVPQR